MIRTVMVLAALLCCLLLSTCGTGRAIVGDYADDYVIRNISPLSGVSGEAVRFEHSVCSNAGGVAFDYAWDADTQSFSVEGISGSPPHYTWNFGGGAEPNVSYAIYPEVTLRDGLRAPYECTLTIRDGCLDDQVVTATFTLNVAPITVLAVSPTIGAANALGVFSAVIGSGNITSYAWDFGGACSPAGSNEENPSVIFTETPGTYTGRLIVGNNFEVFEFPFTITVLADGS